LPLGLQSKRKTVQLWGDAQKSDLLRQTSGESDAPFHSVVLYDTEKDVRGKKVQRKEVEVMLDHSCRPKSSRRSLNHLRTFFGKESALQKQRRAMQS